MLNNETLFFSQKEYINHIEKKLYISEGGFKFYKNGKEISESEDERIPTETGIKQVVLLNTDEEMKKSVITTEEISSIIKKTKAIFEELFLNSLGVGKIMVQFDLLEKGEDMIRMAVMDNIDLELMKVFETRVKAEDYPQAKKKSIKFQIIFQVM